MLYRQLLNTYLRHLLHWLTIRPSCTRIGVALVFYVPMFDKFPYLADENIRKQLRQRILEA
jgi:hypothetical protein